MKTENTYQTCPCLSGDGQRGRRKMERIFFNPVQSLVAVLLVTVISLPSSCHGTIFVVSEISNDTMMAINDMPARFVPERYAFYGMQGYVVYADPPTACTKVKPPPTPYTPGMEYPISWILLAKRSPDCHFQAKIENAQISGYSAIIIHNVGSNDTETMGVEDPGKLMIYATFIGEYDGQTLNKSFTFPNPFFLRIRNDFSVNSYLVPFAVIVGVCIIVMLLFMLWQQVVRWYRERRRSRRRKLPASALKKLPVHKWTKGDPYETCAVCLDDFVEQEKIRILPCAHGYHVICIDRWLTKGRRVCPICKRKVIVADEHFSESDTETEDENAPLIPTTSAAQNPPSGASTFIQNQLNIRIIESLGSRRLLSRMRNRQNPVNNDSDSSSISSGTSQSHSVGEEHPHPPRDHQGLTQSTSALVRPGTSSGRSGLPSRSNSHSVFAEVHQSSEMLRKRLEKKTEQQHRQKEAKEGSSSVNLSGDCVHDFDSQSASTGQHSTLVVIPDSVLDNEGEGNTCESVNESASTGGRSSPAPAGPPVDKQLVVVINPDSNCAGDGDEHNENGAGHVSHKNEGNEDDQDRFPSV